MARGSRSRRNVPPSTVGANELEQPVSPEGTPATSDVGPLNALAPEALVFTPVPATASTNGLFQQFMKAYLENQNQAQTPAPVQAEPREQPLKARFPDLYYGNSHMDCYRFCQQCEDHFETAGATGNNRIPFAASFLRGTVVQRWQQHKRCSQGLVPMTWLEFKNFFQKNLGDSRAFVDNLWSKFRRDSQYQSESVLDWASHLEHLQSILLEFDADGAPGEPTMIRYFREGLKPSIRAEMQQHGRELDSFEDTIQKAVDAEAKAALRPRSAARETDQHCPQGTRPAYSTAAKSQDSPMKDPRVEEPTSRTQEATSSYRPESTETSNRKTRKERKKQRRLEHERAQNNSGSVPTTKVNVLNVSSTTRKDLSHITCFNCDQKGHYATQCPEPKRDASED